MNDTPEIDPGFRKLLTRSASHPFHVNDLFNYLADRQSKAEFLVDNSKPNDRILRDIRAAAVEDIEACKTAQTKLQDFKQAGIDIVYLDVTQDMPQQIAQNKAATTPNP